MSQKINAIQLDNSQLVIDTSAKKQVVVIEAPLEVDHEQLVKMIDELTAMIDNVKQTYYSSNAIIERVQSRDLRDIVGARLNQIGARILTNRTQPNS